jgi:hypothetical protein
MLQKRQAITISVVQVIEDDTHRLILRASTQETPDGLSLKVWLRLLLRTALAPRLRVPFRYQPVERLGETPKFAQ